MSPKVTWPLVAQLALGAILVIVGLVFTDHDVEIAGLGVIGASGITGTLGHRAPHA